MINYFCSSYELIWEVTVGRTLFQTILGYLFRNSHEVGTKLVTKRGEMNFKLDNRRVFPFFVLVAACLSGQVDSYPQNLMVTKSF